MDKRKNTRKRLLPLVTALAVTAPSFTLLHAQEAAANTDRDRLHVQVDRTKAAEQFVRHGQQDRLSPLARSRALRPPALSFPAVCAVQYPCKRVRHLPRYREYTGTPGLILARLVELPRLNA